MNEYDLNEQYGSQYHQMRDKKPMPINKMPIGMAYVPEQVWETPYDVMDGLDRGTLFPSLDKPFLGGGNRW